MLHRQKLAELSSGRKDSWIQRPTSRRLRPQGGATGNRSLEARPLGASESSASLSPEKSDGEPNRAKSAEPAELGVPPRGIPPYARSMGWLRTTSRSDTTTPTSPYSAHPSHLYCRTCLSECLQASGMLKTFKERK